MKIPSLLPVLVVLSTPVMGGWVLNFYSTGGKTLETHGSRILIDGCNDLKASYLTKKAGKTTMLHWEKGFLGFRARVYEGEHCTGNFWGVQEGTHNMVPPKKIRSYDIY